MELKEFEPKRNWYHQINNLANVTAWQENILMEAVKRGGDRQELHEKLRRLNGVSPHQIAEDPDFHISLEEAETLCDPKKLVGRAPNQVREFLGGAVSAFLDRHPNSSIHIPSLNF